MITENTKFKSNFSDKEIFTEIVNRMKDYKLKDLLNKDLFLRAKCKMFNKKDKTYDREKVVKAVIDLVASNSNMRAFVILDLDGKLQRIKSNKVVSEIKTFKDWSNYIYNDNFKSDIFFIIVLLWINDDKELNDFGDRLYKEYLDGKFKYEEELKELDDMNEESLDDEVVEKEKVKMDDNILSMNLGECIKKLSNYEEKISNLKSRLNEKDKEIEELKEKLKLANETKEIKKELKDLNKSLANDNKNKELSTINNNIEKLNNKSLEIEKLLKTNVKDSFQSQENNILKNVNQLLVDQQNVFKSTCKIYNDDLFKEIKNYMDEVIKERVIEIPKENKEEAQKINKSSSMTTENKLQERVENSDNANPLINILDGIKLNTMK